MTNWGKVNDNEILLGAMATMFAFTLFDASADTCPAGYVSVSEPDAIIYADSCPAGYIDTGPVDACGNGAPMTCIAGNGDIVVSDCTPCAGEISSIPIGGVNIRLCANNPVTHALLIHQGGATCYAPLNAGTRDGGINAYDNVGNGYHAQVTGE